MKTFSSYFWLWLIVLCSPALMAQNSLTGTIRDYGNQKLTLNQMKGDRQIVVDSVRSNADGAFSFTFAPDALPGMYILKTATGQSIRLIYNQQDIRFVSGGFSEDDFVEFIESPENELWYAYYFRKNMTQHQQDLLKPLLVQYPDDTYFFEEIKKEFLRLQSELRAFAEKTITENPQSLVARYIRADLTPPLNLDQSFNEQREYLKTLFFDEIDFTDDALIRSDILSRKFIDYIALYQQQGLGMAEMQLSFMRAVDQILLESSVSEQVYVFAVTYLIEGFSRMGLNAVTDFLSGLPHLNPGCMEPETITQLELAITPYRKIVVGAQAPDISGSDINGNYFELSSLTGKRSLILFWSTTCPFCLDLLPEIEKFKTRHPDTKIVSIVLSPDNEELRNIIKDSMLDWVHIVPKDGWRSKLVDDYMVYATPTLVLVDENRRILLKPTNFNELHAFMAE